MMIQNKTHHSSSCLEFIEVPAIGFDSPLFQVNDVNSSDRTFFHSYYPDLSEPNFSTRQSLFRKW